MNSVLVDTSVWVHHLRRGNDALTALLTRDMVTIHPLVLGELACGTPPHRAQTLADLGILQRPRQASIEEAMLLIENERLFGLGCGLVDMLLLASTLMTPGLSLWTLDKKLGVLAARFGISHLPDAVH